MSLACLTGCAAESPKPAAKDSAKTFDVREFGAKGDGKTIDTAAIQKALDECGKAGGTVRVPAGTYLSKPIFLGTRTTLHLDEGATLLATDEPDDFIKPDRKGQTLASGSFFAFINGKNLTDVVISGKGTIDGAGARWWVPAEAARQKTPGYTLPRPRLIILTGCKNVRVQDVTLQNSPTFHFVPTECENVVVTNVTVKAPPRSPNTDAIDPSLCKNVLITHCLIDVGDDNVAIKSGRALPSREFGCEDITVEHCVFLNGHGMSIGSEVIGGVRNVTVRDCTFEGTENGIRIKSRPGRGGRVENITFSNITMKNVDPAITFTTAYGNNSAGDAVQSAAPVQAENAAIHENIPVYKNIHISNLTATTQKEAGIIIGLPESLITNVVLENVNIKAATTGMTIKNARGIQLKNVQVTTSKGPPFILENAQVDGLDNVKNKADK